MLKTATKIKGKQMLLNLWKAREMRKINASKSLQEKKQGKKFLKL